MATLSVQNAFLRSPDLEKEYLALAGCYQPEDVHRMAQLLGCLAGAPLFPCGKARSGLWPRRKPASTDHLGRNNHA